jgi:hypothetical protein
MGAAVAKHRLAYVGRDDVVCGVLVAVAFADACGLCCAPTGHGHMPPSPPHRSDHAAVHHLSISTLAAFSMGCPPLISRFNLWSTRTLVGPVVRLLH